MALQNFVSRRLPTISAAWLNKVDQLAENVVYGSNTAPGVTDMTAVLKTVFEAGGDVYIPAGNYMIKGTGPDSGGVNATITRNLRVRCHPNATFVTDSLDNDMIRLIVPSNGAGLPSTGISVEWYGGTFDQRNQKNSTVIPFIAQYPASNPGTSATCEGLSIRGDYTSGGTQFSGIRLCRVEGVTFYAGEHWQTAGGDSGLFIGGCELQIVDGCRAQGSRDLGVYTSGSTDATLQCKTVIQNCLFVNCFFAASIKRSSGDTEIVANTAENCVRGFLASHVLGNGFNRLRISQNSGRNVGIGVELDECIGYDVSDNHFNTLGALLIDGTTVEPAAGCNGIELNGCVYGSVKHNTINGIQAGVAAAYPTGFMIVRLDTHAVTGTLCQHNQIIGNFGQALRTAGADVGGNANAYIENYVLNAVTSANFSTLGTNSFEVRIDPTTQRRSFQNTVGFADGALGAPSIARAAGVSTGLRFDANLIGLTVSGADSIRVDANAVAGQTRLLVFDVDNNTLERVSVGAPDSGGAGFKLLCIPN